MSAPVITPDRSATRRGRDGFAQLLRAEWTKFRTIRGWVIGVIAATVVIAGIALLDHSSCGGVATPGGPAAAGAGCSAPVGPGGEAVTDRFYFAHRPLAAGGSVTARVTSLAPGHGPAGLQPWSKAGIIIKASTRPGSAYAAMIVTAGHGVRMQYDYTGDIAGPSGAVSPAFPRWLRLTRSGDTLTGAESADGTHWRAVGTVHLARLPATTQAGLFAASPSSTQAVSQSIGSGTGGGALTLAAARFDNIALLGQRPGGGWTGSSIGGDQPPGSGLRQSGGSVTVTGSGDIAPATAGDGTPVERTLVGVFGGLIAVVVVAAMFITAEYRRGLIRVTFSASPARGRVLVAKAVVIGAVTFIASLAGAAAAVLLGERLLRSNGNFILPVSALTEVRVVVGAAALLAAAAVLALSAGTILRHGAGAITAVTALTVVPYFFANPLAVLPAGAAAWLLRVTPAAGFAIEQTSPPYRQVAFSYTPAHGYYPLPPWAGFAVLCAWAAAALGLAMYLLRRRDA